MKFVCMLPVRDEGDIIAQCLDALLSWSDEIFVFDTGSIDETWEVVIDYAGRDKRIVPLRRDPVYFNDTVVRGWIFHQARQSMRNGDWFLRCDADEFHHIPPPEFVRNRMEPYETIAWHQYYNFEITSSDVEDWERGKETVADRKRPIEERRRWYRPSIYSEPRLCQYRESMKWPEWASFPFNAGFVARERLPIRHYPHRDPIQLQRRCRLRAAMMRDKKNRKNWTHPEQHHWSEGEWQNFIVPSSDKTLIHWEPGKRLTETHFENHLAPYLKRLSQRALHQFLLPALDKRRPTWNESAYPDSICEEHQEVLVKLLQGQ